MNAILTIAVLLSFYMYWYVKTHCSLCNAKFTYRDYMANGRVRYRRRGTEWPVCSCCGRRNPNLVD